MLRRPRSHRTRLRQDARACQRIFPARRFGVVVVEKIALPDMWYRSDAHDHPWIGRTAMPRSRGAKEEMEIRLEKVIEVLLPHLDEGLPFVAIGTPQTVSIERSDLPFQDSEPSGSTIMVLESIVKVVGQLIHYLECPSPRRVVEKIRLARHGSHDREAVRVPVAVGFLPLKINDLSGLEHGQRQGIVLGSLDELGEGRVDRGLVQQHLAPFAPLFRGVQVPHRDKLAHVHGAKRLRA